ncbi:MAG: hypothetical protein JWR85_4073 [Marmoricola sp.]|nr:hypothetical protein [Marmoricola sp.]
MEPENIPQWLQNRIDWALAETNEWFAREYPDLAERGLYFCWTSDPVGTEKESA